MALRAADVVEGPTDRNRPAGWSTVKGGKMSGERTQTSEPFVAIPYETLCVLAGKHGALATYAHLLRYAKEQAHCWPHIETLQKDLGGVHRNTVHVYLAELVAVGLIAIERRGRGRDNVYRLLLRTPPAPQEYALSDVHKTEEYAQQEVHNAEYALSGVHGYALCTVHPLKEDVDTRDVDTTTHVVDADAPVPTKKQTREPNECYRVFLAFCGALQETPAEGEPRKAEALRDAKTALAALRVAEPEHAEADLCGTLHWLADKLRREGKIQFLSIRSASKHVAAWRKAGRPADSMTVPPLAMNGHGSNDGPPRWIPVNPRYADVDRERNNRHFIEFWGETPRWLTREQRVAAGCPADLPEGDSRWG